ncbi:hypothetical protein [Paracoccus mutanolyticus]|uniref:hypothetical protein n=1 Tax=Paracoccus mutanolyticus TaxID=1499308 RepID=UPI001CB89DCF|nr:hypothetical protein [Paracoccus mutanolyticus]
MLIRAAALIETRMPETEVPLDIEIHGVDEEAWIARPGDRATATEQPPQPEAKADFFLNGGTDLLRHDVHYDLGITGALKTIHFAESVGTTVEMHGRPGAARAYRVGLPRWAVAARPCWRARCCMSDRLHAVTPWAGSAPLARAKLSASLLDEITMALRDVSVMRPSAAISTLSPRDRPRTWR